MNIFWVWRIFRENVLCLLASWANRVVSISKCDIKKHTATLIEVKQTTWRQQWQKEIKGSASLERRETLLWASGAALGLVDDDCLGLEAVFGPVSQVVQRNLFGVQGKHLLKDKNHMLGVSIWHLRLKGLILWVYNLILLGQVDIFSLRKEKNDFDFYMFEFCFFFFKKTWEKCKHGTFSHKFNSEVDGMKFNSKQHFTQNIPLFFSLTTLTLCCFLLCGFCGICGLH